MTTVTGPATARAGALVPLVADVRNNGSGAATSTVATLILPPRLLARASSIAIDGAPAGAACSVDGGVITCQLGVLASGSTARIAWQAVVAGSANAGAYVVQSNATSPVTDPVPANNAATWTILIARFSPPLPPAKPRLAVNATNDRKTVRPGGEVETTIVVRNAGPGVAHRTLVCTPVPEASSFVSARGAFFRQGRACWSIARLGVASSRRFTIRFRVDTTAVPGPVRSLVHVTALGVRGVLSAQALVVVLAASPTGRPGGVTG